MLALVKAILSFSLDLYLKKLKKGFIAYFHNFFLYLTEFLTNTLLFSQSLPFFSHFFWSNFVFHYCNLSTGYEESQHYEELLTLLICCSLAFSHKNVLVFMCVCMKCRCLTRYIKPQFLRFSIRPQNSIFSCSERCVLNCLCTPLSGMLYILLIVCEDFTKYSWL